MWTRIALYATLGYTLDALEQPWNTWGFWAILGLFWASEHMTRIETIDSIWAEVEAMRKRKENSND